MSLGIIDSCIISSFICHKGGGGSVSLCGTLVCSCGPALLVRLACVSTPTCIASSARRSTIVSTYLPAVCPLCGLWSSYAGPLCIRQDAITIIHVCVPSVARHTAKPSVARRCTIVSTYYHRSPYY